MKPILKSICGECYVSVICKDSRYISKKRINTLDELADKYHALGRGDPKLGLPKNHHAHEGQRAYVFEGTHKATKFSTDILELDYVKEIRIGYVEK